MNILLSWLQSFSAPCTMAVGTLGMMIYSLIHPRFFRGGLIALTLAALTFLRLTWHSPVPLSHDLTANPWIYTMQALLLTGWLIYLFILSFWRSSQKHMTPDILLLLLLSLVGMLASLHAQSFLTLFLCLEILSLPLYISTGAVPQWKEAPEAALKYFILGSLASGIMIFGISLIYGAIQSLDLSRWFQSALNFETVCTCDTQPLFWVGSIMTLIGLFFKMAIVPFHMWTPDLYKSVPLPLTFFYSLFPKIVVAGILSRLFTHMSGTLHPTLEAIGLLLGGVSILIGGFGTLRPHHLGRLLGYSSILNSGFFLWSTLLPQESGTLLVLASGYALSLLGLMAVLASCGFPAHLQDLKGLWSQAPYHTVALTLAIASWIGLPPMAGFWGKFQILNLLFQKGHYVGGSVGIIGSILGCAYGLRVIRTLWFAPSSISSLPLGVTRSWHGSVLILALALLILGFGVVLLIFN